MNTDKFHDFLISRIPVFDEAILSNWRPVDEWMEEPMHGGFERPFAWWNCREAVRKLSEMSAYKQSEGTPYA